MVIVALAPAGVALDRNAWTATSYKLNVSVGPDQSTFDAEGTVELRNDSQVPQRDIALQVSSSLEWRGLQRDGQPVQWLSQTYTSDIDHTGVLSEAIATLPQPVPPGGAVRLDIHYTGTIPRDATRLTRIGTPENVAIRSDWDQIGRDFTAVRGLGHVVWYPVAIEAANLENGTEVWDAIARWKQRHANSVLEARIRAVTAGDEKPPVIVTNAGGDAGESVQRFALDQTPFFAIGPYQKIPRENVVVFHTADHTSIARDYVIAAEKALSTTRQWFGDPKQKITIVELADPDTLPFDDGTFLLTPLKPVPPLALEVALARTAARASLDSSRPWIREGLASFAQALVREKQQGRKAGLAYLNQFVNALATAEAQTKSTAAQGESSSSQMPSIGPQPLASTNDELFYRTKAAFAWWMLRDLVGEDGIKTAISRYKASADREPSYMQRLLENSGTTKRYLEPFFDTWVYRDKGIADLHLVSAVPRKSLAPVESAAPDYTVVVTVENLSDVWVNAPIVVRSPAGERSERLAIAPRSKAVARVQFPSVPTEVIVNDGSIPEVNLDDNRTQLEITPQKR